MDRFLSFVPTQYAGHFQDLGLHPATDFTSEGSNFFITTFTNLCRFHWLPAGGTIEIAADFVYGGHDGSGHDYTSTVIPFSTSIPFSRTWTSMDDLIDVILGGGGAGDLFSISSFGSVSVGGSHKVFTEPTNDAVAGDYTFSYGLQIGMGSTLAVPRIVYANDGSEVYVLLQVSGGLSFSPSLISGSLSTGFPPGEVGTLVGQDTTLYAIPYAPTSEISNAGSMGLINTADPTNNPITAGGGYNATMLYGSTGQILGPSYGLQNIDVQVNIDSNLTLPTY